MIPALVALLGAFILSGVLIPVLRTSQFIDVPNHRSSHITPIPRGGGLAVLLAIGLGTFADREVLAEAWPVVAIAGGLALVGLADDFKPLPGSFRLVMQLVAAVALTWWAVGSAPEGSAPAALFWWVPVFVVVLVGYVNAFNFMDGINGISGLSALVVGGWWAVLGHREGVESLQVLGLVLAGAAAGFLPWNAPRARVFLGDVGSYGLGLFIAALSVLAVCRDVAWPLALAPLAVYLADAGWVLVKRAVGGRSLMEAHREHIYQRLVDGGWSHTASATLCAGVAALVCLAVLTTWPSMPLLGAALVGFVLLGYLMMPRTLVRTGAAS